ncbi:MAG: hypothetical protein PHY47_24775 [Lachnospiraceae bacterium]|nr:hypothetical protein [Lachnospiraceae bacterium]
MKKEILVIDRDAVLYSVTLCFFRKEKKERIYTIEKTRGQEKRGDGMGK